MSHSLWDVAAILKLFFWNSVYWIIVWQLSQWNCSQANANGPHPLHDDVIKRKHFPRYWPFVRGIHQFPVNSPHKGQWRGALMFSLICVWINDWVNNREAGDLRRYRVHYDVIILKVHISSDNDLERSVNKPLSEPMFTQIGSLRHEVVVFSQTLHIGEYI